VDREHTFSPKSEEMHFKIGKLEEKIRPRPDGTAYGKLYFRKDDKKVYNKI